MKKSDLKQGAICQTRNGDMHILIGKELVDLKDGCYIRLEDVNDDLTGKDFGARALDIIKVFQDDFEYVGYHEYIRNNIKWTWERNETSEQLAKLQAENERLKKELEKLKSKTTNDLQVGDNVVIIYGDYKGYNGKIVGIDGENDVVLYLVYMGKKFKGHNGGPAGNCQQNNEHNCWFARKNLKKVN